MHDVLFDILAALLLVAGAATFAGMIWAARQVDGRAHPAPRLHLHLPHPHRRPRA
ncbi:MAG TPA: hypothetical protein VFV85_09965 [Conexibacter sp.]|nr:hypothetical protein [Conexibacter sp.]